jgi:predicted small secreted protein
MMIKLFNRLLIVVLSCLVFSACAELEEAGRDIGHGTRDAAKAIGHGTRDATKAIGHATRDAVKDVGEGVKKISKAENESK